MTGDRWTTIKRLVLKHEAQRLGRQARDAGLETAPPIETFGLDVTPRWLGKVYDTSERLQEAANALTGVSRHIVEAEKRGVVCHRDTAELKKAVALVRRELSAVKPHTICPSCKMVEVLMPSCPVCMGQGWVTRAVEKELDPRLRSNDVLYVRTTTGELEEYDSFFPDDDVYQGDELTEDMA